MGKSKLLPFIALGALAGAVVSMFDKSTREHTIESTKKVKETVSYYVENREELQNLIETKVEQAQSFYTNTSENYNSLMSKAEDALTLPSTIQSLLTETKDAFLSNEKK
ncbi:YtxH domain-containing protein [Solibacillus sp. FSL H8-0538]|uniref:YtxH domain-containing protein n=1 Tax=Solibacillus sp. FSL H8-0538 TaxID=2921400 RepID=UPI0030F6BB2E